MKRVQAARNAETFRMEIALYDWAGFCQLSLIRVQLLLWPEEK